MKVWNSKRTVFMMALQCAVLAFHGRTSGSVQAFSPPTRQVAEFSLPRRLPPPASSITRSYESGLLSTMMTTERPTEKVPSTLREALITFFARSYNGPRTIVLAIAALVGWRCSLLSSVPFSASEGLLAITTILFWCFQEHVLHQHVLHSKVSWYGKNIHQDHHDQPYLQISIDPGPLMIGWMATVGVILAWLLPSTSLSLTGTIAYACAGLFYEWTHYIVHTQVKFRKNGFWDALKVHHVKHHLVDSNNWFAFSWRRVDDIMGTNPSVPKTRQ